MRKRFVSCAMLTAFALASSGCPFGALQVLPGVWLFDFGGGELRALELLADGTTNTLPNPAPPGTTGFFGGSPFWRQHGSTFVMAHEVTDVLLYTGRVESPSSMSGTQHREDSSLDRPWTATRVE